MKIELNNKQVKLIALALEQHSRMLCGQFDLTFLKGLETALYRDCKYNDDFWQRRDTIDIHLKEVKRLAFPELSENESYGIGRIKEADLGYEMYKEILYHFETIKEKEEGNKYKSNVHSYKPLKLTTEPIIKIES